ncbi:MAG: MFS transporter [Pseudomonadota bacterium]
MGTTTDATNRSTVWLEIIALFVATALASLTISIAAVSLQTISADLANTDLAPSLVVMVYIMAATAAIIPVGRLGDHVGKRRVLNAGFLLFALGALGASLVQNMRVLLVCRALQGLGAEALLTVGTDRGSRR